MTKRNIPILSPTIAETLSSIAPLDERAMERALKRQGELTKPPGSLGRLEELSIHVAGITGQARPRIEHKVIFTIAADHGVAAEGVSAYPQQVTRQMVLNFLRGGAAINVLGRHVGAKVIVVDAGIVADLPPHPNLRVCKVGYGTANMARGPAMSRRQAEQTLTAGIELVESTPQMDIVAVGEMGIANTTAASAIAAAFTGRPVVEVTGRGTGIDDRTLTHKVAVIEQALNINRPDPQDPLDVLSKIGGFEIGAIAGVVLGAAARRVPVVIDGLISSAGALIATELCPQARAYCIAAHRSVEKGHTAILERMQLTPLLDLDMRLGEGTGAALGIGLVEAACKVLDEMATFDQAGVSKKE